MRVLGERRAGFESHRGTPINPGNAPERYVRPVVLKLGISIGGWHDFRHTLITRLRKLGWAPKVTSQITGHSTIRITEEIYDHADAEGFRLALSEVAGQLEPDQTKSASVN
jgi:integrase